MDNHYHVVVEMPEGSPSHGMRPLNCVCTQYVNCTHDRPGHVFRGRFNAMLVERDTHQWELASYVVSNLLRAL